MNAQRERTLVSDQESKDNPGPPREGEDQTATADPVQPPIQRPDGDDPRGELATDGPNRREVDTPTPTPNEVITPVDRPDGPDSEPDEPGWSGRERGETR
jgi:hypothetical protein